MDWHPIGFKKRERSFRRNDWNTRRFKDKEESGETEWFAPTSVELDELGDPKEPFLLVREAHLWMQRRLLTGLENIPPKVWLQIAQENNGTGLEGLNLCYTRLRGIQFPPGISLRGAILAGADLEGASLIAADLSGADLRGAKLGTKVTDIVCLKGAILKDVKIDHELADCMAWQKQLTPQQAFNLTCGVLLPEEREYILEAMEAVKKEASLRRRDSQGVTIQQLVEREIGEDFIKLQEKERAKAIKGRSRRESSAPRPKDSIGFPLHQTKAPVIVNDRIRGLSCVQW